MKGIYGKPWLIIGIVAIFSFASSPLVNRQSLTTPTAAPHRPAYPAVVQTARDIYTVEIFILNISSIDLNAGTYSLDFYLMLTCQNPPCTYEPNWDILNTTSEFSAADQGVSIPFEYYEYRVKAAMIGPVDYSFYPFDYVYIEIFVEDKAHKADQLTYQFDAIRVDPTLFDPSGWFHHPDYDGGETYQSNYGDPAIFYDRLEMWLFLERDWFGAFMKTIFAAIVIVMVGMLSFLMKTDAITERLALVSSTLVAIVLYHISLVAGVPATGYLTFTDKFMVWTYLIVFVSLVIAVMMMVYVNSGRIEQAERLHARTRWLIPLLWVLIMAFVFVKDLYIPYGLLVGDITWPKNLTWLANLLGYTRYLSG